MQTGLHHLHKRKRISQKNLEPYPSKDKLKNLLDKLVYIMGAFGLIMTIPQILKIWLDQNAAGVSVISWSAYLLSSIVWVAYGIVHKEKPIIVIYSMWIIMKLLIIIGTILYG